MKSQESTHIILSSLGLVISILVLLFAYANQPEPKVFWTWSVWSPPILTFVITELGFNLLVLIRRVKNPFSWVPELEQSSGLSQKIMNAKYNFCAISSKDPALWRSPTFMSYLIDNITKTLTQISAFYQVPLVLSMNTDDKEDYIRECKETMNNIGNEQDPEGFIGLRLMIYDDKILKTNEKLLNQIINLHAKGGMYCVPVSKDILMENLLKEDRRTIKNWLTSIGTYKKKQEEKAKIIPDILIIDNHSRAPSSGDSVWWFEKNTWKTGKDQFVFDSAKKGFAMLCRRAIISKAISTDFTSSSIEAVAIPSRTALVNKFFSLPYFQRWLEQAPPQFQRWFKAEEDFLIDLAKNNPNSTFLDVGCGLGRHATLLAKKGIRVYGVDNNPTMIEGATSQIKFDPSITELVDLFLEDVQKMHFEDETFDVIICMTNTFGNLPNIEESVLREMARVLKPNGKIYLSVYCDDQSFYSLREQTYHNIGLHVKRRNGKSIELLEGLYSKHFSRNELENTCRLAGLIPNIREITALAYLCEARKTSSKN